jgi:hypothetical protein
MGVGILIYTTTKPTEMTPKEKAEELFSKYYNSIEHTLSEEYSPHEMFVVKECALIAVDEILSDYKNYLLHANTEYKGLMYWNEVRQELEKL